MDKNYRDSFSNAFWGLKYAFSEHPNFRIHLILSILVLLASWFFQIETIEFLVLLLTILIGFTVEFLNTVIESVCDLVTTQWNKDIKIAKDVSAGMMVVVAVGSLIIAAIIFYPYILGI